MKMPRLHSTILLFLAFLSARDVRADFKLRDGDTVVFLGDSITAARQYGKIIENYTLLRFPERKIQFINAGQGGETIKGSLKRLETDVFQRGATVLTVAYGINDIGWGVKADEAHKQEYLSAIGELIDRCKARNVRVFICSAAITAETPDKAEVGFLQRMCDEGLAVASAKGAGTIDVQREMRAIQKRIVEANARQQEKAKHTRLHAEDGIHLNDLGQMAMAYSILKGLDAPSVVSTAVLDGTSASIIEQEGCRIQDLNQSAGVLTFTRLDHRLPMNLHSLWMLQGIYIPIGDQLNRQVLAVRGLPSGRYEVMADERPLGKWKSEDLNRGINIASATEDPWQPGNTWAAQGYAVTSLTTMRDDLVHAMRGMERDITASSARDELLAKAVAIEKAIVELQRFTARPTPVRFQVRKVSDDQSRSLPKGRSTEEQN